MGEREWGKGEREKKRKFKKQKGGERKGEREQIPFVLPHAKRGKWKTVSLPS